MRNASDLPDDTDALKAMLAASLAAIADRDAVIEHKEDRIVRLEKLLADFKRAFAMGLGPVAAPWLTRASIREVRPRTV